MKFRIAKEAFLDGLQQVQHVVSSRTTLPILSNVLIEAGDGGLRLSTTDLDVSVSGVAEAEVSREGITTLPVKKLVNIIRELPSAEIDISVDGKNVATIESGPSRFKIIGMAADEFPPFPDFKEAKEYRIPQTLIKNGIRKTSYAISTDETRYVLNGIFASFKEGKLTLVATDGRRLALVENELEFPSSHERDFIIPSKAVQELSRLLNGEGDTVVRLSDNQISFEAGSSILVSKLIEGNYPNYRQVIPGEARHSATFSRDALLDTTKRVSLLSSEKSNSIKLAFSTDSLRVSANSPDIGEADETLAVKYDGPDLAIAFNPEFLKAPLQNLDDEEIRLDLIDEMSPGVLRSEGSFLYVLMPMRVSN